MRIPTLATAALALLSPAAHANGCADPAVQQQLFSIVRQDIAQVFSLEALAPSLAAAQASITPDLHSISLLQEEDSSRSIDCSAVLRLSLPADTLAHMTPFPDFLLGVQQGGMRLAENRLEKPLRFRSEWRGQPVVSFIDEGARPAVLMLAAMAGVGCFQRTR